MHDAELDVLQKINIIVHPVNKFTSNQKNAFYITISVKMCISKVLYIFYEIYALLSNQLTILLYLNTISNQF